MTTLEDRLREQLPELADALTDGASGAHHAPPSESARLEPVAVSSTPDRPRRSTRAALVSVAAATLLLVTGGLVVLSRRDTQDAQDGAASPANAPSGFGEWEAIADAPIEPRPYAVSAWTGSEAVFWAGSSLTRGFAHTDGAAYDPDTGMWRDLTVPGWGHPGLTSTFFAGEIYALAKGGVSLFDPVGGTWNELPQAEGMLLASLIATDDAVWGLGPAATNPGGQPDLAIARYDGQDDSWVDGPVFEGTAQQSQIVADLSRLETDVVWTGTEILAWSGTHGGIAFDPATERWRTVEPPTPPSGRATDTEIAMTDAGVVALVTTETTSGSAVTVAIRAGDGWRWTDTTIPVEDPSTLSVAPAGQWVALFTDGEAPALVHVPSGAWDRSDDSPLGGRREPNTVWTGEQLIVWGGAVPQGTTNPGLADGASWTPPA